MDLIENGGIDSWGSRSKHSLYIPYLKKGNPCAVGLIYRLKRKPIFFRNRHLTLIENYVDQLTKMIHKSVRTLTRLVIYAHPGDELDGFAINSAHKEKVIKPSFFESMIHEKHVLYAHVCEGALVLSKEEWKELFPHWVSYQDGFGFHYGRKGEGRFYKQLLKDLERSVLKSNSSVEEMKHSIETVYIKHLDKIMSPPFNISLVKTMTNLQEAKSFLVTSKDV